MQNIKKEKNLNKSKFNLNIKKRLFELITDNSQSSWTEIKY